MVRRAGEVDRHPTLVPVKLRPREVDVVVAAAVRVVVGLDRRLVVELTEKIRRRRSAGDDHGLPVALAVVLRIATRAVRVVVGRNPDVAEGLRRAGGVVRALRAEERAALGVPGDHRVARARRAHLLLGDLAVRRCVVRIAGHE